MATVDVNGLFFFAIFILFVELGTGIFNIEEIHSINYAIDIFNKPVLSGQIASGSVMYLKSRYGQEYQCSLPEIGLINDDGHSSEDATLSNDENDIAKLLRPLEDTPCLIKMKDWWTYEFCFGKYIRQYHTEDNRKSGPEILLGVYDSEFDWKNNSQHDEQKRNRLQRYHSQYYVNGTQCDVTGNLRRAEVRFLCEEGSGNYIARVDEPESCRYVLTVHTAHVCHHPFLRPAPSNRPQAVSCNPVLTAEQYEEYLFKEEEAKKAAEEKRQQWIRKQEEQLEELKKNMESEKEKEESSDISDESANDDQKTLTDDDELKVNIKFITKKNVESSVETVLQPLADDVVESSDDAEETQLMQELAKELDEVSKNEKINLAGLKNKLQKSIEFGEIIDEAEEEMNENLNENDRMVTFSQLASTLNKILKELDRAEQDITEASKKLEKVQQKIDSHSHLEKLKAENSVENSDIVDDSGEQRSIGGHKIKLLQEKDVDQSQRLHLEQAIRQKLEQSGMDTRGKKIELKIVTAEYVGKGDDSNDDEYHLISEDESKHFQNLIITFLAGNQEAAEQMERQQQLEENYRFVWGQDERPNKENDDE